MADPAPNPPGATRRIVLAFVAVTALVLVCGLALLSVDQPLARHRDPETDNAYVDGDATPVSAEVAGYVRRLAVNDNQAVASGDLLAEIERDDYVAQLDQARAQLLSAQAMLAATLGQVTQLAAQTEQTRTNEVSAQADVTRAGPELRRQRLLVNTDAGLRRNLDVAEADQKRFEAGTEAARASVEMRRRQVDVLEAQRRQQAATVAAREADARTAEINLAYTRIVAPIAGVVGTRRVRAGDLLAIGAAVLTITPLDTVWVTANFTERQITDMRVGQRARLSVDTFSGQPLAGHVVGIAPLTGSQLAAAPADNTTGNYTKVVQRVPVRIAIDWNASGLKGLVRPGMSVVATVFAP